MGSSADSLMDSNNSAYVYDVLVRRLDARGAAASASRIYYNYLHLPLREEHYQVAPGGAFANGYRALYTYDIDLDYHARTTAYTQPVGVEQFVFDDGAQAYRALRKSVSSYDAFGQLLASEEFLYDAGRQAYVSQLQTAMRYQPASWGGELPLLETHADQVSGCQRQIAYALTPDGAGIQSAAVSWRADAGAAWAPWKTRSSSFDAQGRVLSETLAWSPGAAVPPGSVASATSTRRYDYDAAQRLYGSSAIDPLGHATTTVYDVGLAGGPVVATRLPLGQAMSARHDAIGRIVAMVDPLGHETSTSYTIGKDGNSVTTLGPTGYLVRQDFDALGRPTALSDNGDPTRSQSAGANRVLRTTAYDMLGRVARAADELGLAMEYQYDGLGRVVQRRDPLGNQYVTRWLDGQLMAEEYLNGLQRSASTVDGFGRTVSLLAMRTPATRRSATRVGSTRATTASG
jgi:YD repeat-containing protein